MSLISRMRRQTAVWWARTGVDSYGAPEWAEPVEIACRWEEKAELIRTAAGDEVVSRAVVYVDRDMNEGDMLAVGTLLALDSGQVSDPREVDGVGEVKSFGAVPNLRATEELKTAWLI